MLLSVSQCQEKKTILAASHCEAQEIERVAMFWQSKSILNRKKNVLAIKTNPAAKERVLVLSQSWPVWSAVWQCGSVVVWSTQCGQHTQWNPDHTTSTLQTCFCQNLVWFEIYDLLFTMVLLHSIRASCAFVHLYLYMCMCIRICLPCLVSMQGKRFNL